METRLDGPITKYIDLIGRGINGIQEQVDKATNGLACEPLIEDTDESFLGAGSTESYWSYYSAGLELQWRNDILVVLSIYLQDDSLYEEPYIPLSYKLLTSISNTASIQEVINTFGDPEFEGGLWGKRICDIGWMQTSSLSFGSMTKASYGRFNLAYIVS